MESLYFDEIHKGGKDTKNLLIKVGIIALGVILTLIFLVLTFTAFGQFAFLLAVGSAVGTGYLIRYKSKEYEYIFTNGEVDIDMISGRMMRKRLCTIKPEEIENIMKYSDEEYKKLSSSAVKVLDASTGIKEDCYLISVSLNHTKTLVIMSPTSRLIDAWKPYLKKLDYMLRFQNM